MINHLITIPRDNMTMKTKASHRLGLFKAKSCFPSEHSGVLLGRTGKGTSLLVAYKASFALSDEGVSASLSPRRPFLAPVPSLKGREGHRHRGITAESVAARNQTAAGSRPRIGEPLAARGAARRLLLALLHHTCHTRLGL